MLNYQTLIRTLGGATGARIALEDESVSYTYEQLHARTSAFAAGLVARGFERGDAVVWLSPNRADYLVAYLGAAKAGLRFAPINFWLRDNEIRTAIELVRPRAVFAAPEFSVRLDEVCADLDIELRVELPAADVAGTVGWTPWESVFVDGDPDTVFDSDENTPHEIIFTSGTTGQVKGVARTQRQRIMEALVSVVVQPQGKDAFVLRGAPQFHVGGGTGPLQTLIQGGRTRIYKFAPAAMIRHLEDGVTHISGVPAQFQILFESGLLDGVDTSRVRMCGIGGNGAAPEQFLQIQRAFPNAELVHFYGSTESGMISSIRGDEFHARLRSIGRVAPGVDLRLVDRDGNVVPTGQVGEIEARSEHQMIEYYRRPDLTDAAVTADGYLRMGDLGQLDEDGYLYVVGRSKDMIISGGENIYPKEVEDVISGVRGVQECAVIGVYDPVFEERVIAVVKCNAERQGDDEELAAAIIAAVRAELAGYKAPKKVHVVQEFPRNALGKIDKVKLREEQGALRVS